MQDIKLIPYKRYFNHVYPATPIYFMNEVISEYKYYVISTIAK